MKSWEPRFWSKVDVRRFGCWLWQGATTHSGYGRFQLKGKARVAHRVAWQLANGPIPDGLLVCHRCDTPACVRPSHMFLGTWADNLRDMAEKGRSRKGMPNRGTRGEKNRHAKLSADAVRKIRELHAKGVSQKDLADRFSVAPNTVSTGLAGRTWRHV